MIDYSKLEAEQGERAALETWLSVTGERQVLAGDILERFSEKYPHKLNLVAIYSPDLWPDYNATQEKLRIHAIRADLLEEVLTEADYVQGVEVVQSDCLPTGIFKLNGIGTPTISFTTDEPESMALVDKTIQHIAGRMSRISDVWWFKVYSHVARTKEGQTYLYEFLMRRQPMPDLHRKLRQENDD